MEKDALTIERLPKSLTRSVGVGLIAVSAVIFLFITDRSSYASDALRSSGQSLKLLKSINLEVSASAKRPAAKTEVEGVSRLLNNSESTRRQPQAGRYCIQNGAIRNGVQGGATANPGFCQLSQLGRMANPMFGRVDKSTNDHSVQAKNFQAMNPMTMMLRWCAMFSRSVAQNSI